LVLAEDDDLKEEMKDALEQNFEEFTMNDQEDLKIWLKRLLKSLKGSSPLEVYKIHHKIYEMIVKFPPEVFSGTLRDLFDENELGKIFIALEGKENFDEKDLKTNRILIPYIEEMIIGNDWLAEKEEREIFK